MPQKKTAAVRRPEPTYTVEMLDVGTLKPHPRNYRNHPNDQLEHLRYSLETHGVYRNVVIARDGTILAGHGVVQAAKKQGIRELPCFRMDVDPDDEQALKVLIGDNQIARLAMDDDQALTAMLRDLHTLEGTGFDATMLANLAPTPAAVPPDDVEPQLDRAEELRQQYGVEVGQRWQCGRHRVICGNALDEQIIHALLINQSPHMIWADPPYGISIVATNGYVGGGEAYDIPFGGVKSPRQRIHVGGGQRQKDLTGHYPIETWGNRKAVRGTDGAAKPFGSKAQQARGTDGASHVVNVGKYMAVIGDESPETAIRAATYFLTTYPDAVHIWWGGNYYADHLPPSGCWLVWDKETTGHFADCELAWTNQARAARLFRHRWNGMLRDSEREKRWHPTQKPAALAAWAYETLGAAGETILDPFLGSGPALLAAEHTGRTLFGVEIVPEYCAVSLDRWARLTGQTPQLLATSDTSR